MFKIFSTYICWIYKMQPLKVSGAVRPIYGSLGVKRLMRRECSYLHCIILYFPDGQFTVLPTQPAYENISMMRHRSWRVTSQICAGSSFCFIGPISWPLKMEPKGFTEKCVTNCHHTIHNIPEGGRSHWHRGGSLKWRTKLNSPRDLVR